MPARLGDLFSGKSGFILLSTLAFAGCFLLSDYGTAKHLQWLNGWPPLLFIFVVPPEYRWRFAPDLWVRDVLVAMTTVTCAGLMLSACVEAFVYHLRDSAPSPSSDLLRLIAVVVLGGVLFGVLSLFSAWGLYSVFYRPGGPIARRRTKPPDP